MAKSHLKLVAPTEVNRTVTPTRRPNAELRTREHAKRGRSADRGGQGQPPRAAGRHHDPSGLPARAARRRGLRPALGPVGLQCRRPARAAGQEWHAQDPSLARRRDAALRRLHRESSPSPFVFVTRARLTAAELWVLAGVVRGLGRRCPVGRWGCRPGVVPGATPHRLDPFLGRGQ